MKATLKFFGQNSAWVSIVLFLTIGVSSAWAGANLSLDLIKQEIVMKAHFVFYGKVDETKAMLMAKEIESMWSANGLVVNREDRVFKLYAKITHEVMSEEKAKISANANKDAGINYILIKSGDSEDRSYMTAIGANTGVFYLSEDLGNSTVGAHEFGHALGLPHSDWVDWRNKGRPAIMCSYGTIVDPEFQIDPKAEAGEAGGTLSLYARRVLQVDVDQLKLSTLPFPEGKESLGRATNKMVTE